MRVRETDPSEAYNFLAIAKELVLEMKDSLMRERYSATAILAVHATISACDAVTSAKLGQVSKGTNHMDAVKLLRKVETADNTQIQQFQNVLSVKSEVEYQGRRPSPREADLLAKQSNRFVTWAKQIV